MGTDLYSFSRAQMVLIFVQLFPSRSGEEGKLGAKLHSVFSPFLLQCCMWAKLKCICIWGGMCAGVGGTSKEGGSAPYVLLHCRFYFPWRLTLKSFWFLIQKNCSCLAVLGQYCRRIGCHCLVLLSLQLRGCKHQLSWRKLKSPGSLLLMLDEGFSWIQI